MKDYLLKTIGEVIENLRIERNVSRAKLEEACGLPNQSIKRIERNPSMTFDVSALCAIADFFDVDVEYLLGKQKEKRRVTADASKVTGLSYEAVDQLIKWKGHQFPVADFLSKMICNPNFYSLMERMTNLINLTPETASIEIINSEVQRLTSKLEGKKSASPTYYKRDDVYDTQENLVIKSFSEILRSFENK